MRDVLKTKGDFVLCFSDSAGNLKELITGPLLVLEELVIQLCKELDDEHEPRTILARHPEWRKLPWEGSDISAHSVEDVGRIYWFFEEKMMGKGHEVGFYSDEEVDTLNLMEDKYESTDSH